MGADQFNWADAPYVLYGLGALVVIVFTAMTFLATETFHLVRALTRLIRDVSEFMHPTVPMVYKTVERRSGLGTEGEPPMSAEDMNRMGRNGWRLVAFACAGNGDLHYVFEKEQDDG
jgi:hypothetical protein